MNITSVTGLGPAEARLQAISHEMADVPFKKGMTGPQKHARLDALEAEWNDIENSIRNFKHARAVRGASEISDYHEQNLIAAQNHTGGFMTTTKAVRPSGAQVAPLGFDEPTLKALHTAAVSRQSLQVKNEPAFNTVDPLLPPQLLPQVVGPQHEGRLLNSLLATPTSAPSVEYIRHTSTTGSVAVVPEGGLKPELTFVTDSQVCTPVKLACHTAISHESSEDWPTFTGYVQQEITRQLIDAENDLLLNANTTQKGLLHTASILSHDVTGDETPLDAIESAIAELRVGAALATANLLVLNPNTWSAVRRSKDLQDRYLVTADPTVGEASTVWGVPVLSTTVLEEGVGVLIDTTKMGYVVVREAITLKTATNGDDVIYNLIRIVAEERLGLCVERPAAVLAINGLPVAGS